MSNSSFISISDLKNILDLKESITNFKSRMKRNGIKFININEESYLAKEEVERISRNKRCNLPFGMEIPNGYLHVNECAEELRMNRTKFYKSYEHVQKYYDNPLITIKIGVYLFIEEDSFRKLYKDRLALIKLKESEEWIDMNELNEQLQYYIEKSIFNDIFDTKYLKWINTFGEEGYFVYKNVANNIIREIKLKASETSLTKLEDIYNIGKIKDVLQSNIYTRIRPRFIKDTKDTKGKKIVYYTVNKLANILKISVNRIIELIECGVLKNFLKMKNGKKEIIKPYQIKKAAVEKIIILNNYITAFYVTDTFKTITEIKKQTIGNKTTAINRTLKQLMKNCNFDSLEFKGSIYAKSEIIFESYRRYLLSNIANEVSDVRKIANLAFRLIETSESKTFELAKKYINNEIQSYDGKLGTEKHSEFMRNIHSIVFLFSNLEKEIFLYDNQEIKNFISQIDMKLSHLYKLSKFLNFTRKSLGEKCRYNIQIGGMLIEQLRNIENDDERFIYTEEQWYRYYENLINIDKHIIKAFNSDRYAQAWLYCLLHLSITWRRKDVLEKIHNINLEIVEIYDFDWFKENNVFTLSMAMKILESVKFSLDGIIAYKNNMNLHFNVPLSVKIPTSVALIICEIYRRKNNQQRLFYNISQEEICRDDYGLVFDNDDVLIEFSNIKANRSLMTLGYINAMHSIGKSGAAYSMQTWSRAHKEKIGQISPTAKSYLRLSNKDGSPARFALQLFERNSFGYLYFKVLEACYTREKINVLTQDEMTMNIKVIQNNISPIEIENLSEFIINNDEKIEISIAEMLSVIGTKESSLEERRLYFKLMREILVRKYESIANELFKDKNGRLVTFIKDSCKSIDESFEQVLNKETIDSIIKDILDGNRNSITEYTNCILNKNEIKEKCPYKGITSCCIGCNNNLMTNLILYEINSKLNNIMNEMINNEDLDELELILNTHLIQNYLYIMIQAKVYYEKLDKDFLNAFFDQDEITKKYKKIKEMKKFLFIE